MLTHDNKQDPHCVQSRTGCAFCLANCPILWKSKMQTEIALSTMRVKYVALSTSCRNLFSIIDITKEKKARATEIAITTATRVVGNEEGNGKGGKRYGSGNKEDNGDQRQQHGQWLWQQGWWASNGSNNGNGDGDSTKDTAAHTTTGERGMMVVMGHGLCVFLCVCGKTAKNKVGPKQSQCVLELKDRSDVSKS